MDAAGERRRGGAARRGVRAARERRVGRCRALPRRALRARRAGRGARRAPLPAARSTTLGPGARGRAPGHPVGRGVRSTRAPASSTSRPGCGAEDFELARVHDLPVLTPGRRVGPLLRRVRLAPRPLDGARPPTRSSATSASAGPARPRGPLRAPLPPLLALRHAAHLPDHRRLVHLRRRAPPAAARRERDRRVDARVHGQAHGRLAPEHGRLEHLAPPLLRPAAARSTRARCGHLTVDRLAGRARGARDDAGSTGSRSSAARGSTTCRSAASGCGERGRARRRGRRRLARRRHRPVLDARLGEPRVRRPRATRRAPRAGSRAPTCPTTPTGRSGSPPTGSRRCASRSGSGSTRSSSCPSRSPGGRRSAKVLGYEKMLDETGREMHGSWGNMIDAPDAFARMGADVMRWQYCAQPPDRNLLFGFGPAHEIQRKLLTLWNSVGVPRPVRQRSRRSRPRLRRPRGAGGDLASRSTAWLVERTRQLVEEATERVRALADRRRDPRVRGVRRRPLELVHPLLAPPLLGRRRGRRCACSGTRSCRRCGWSRPSCRSSPSTSGRCSCASRARARRTRSSSPAGPRCGRRTAATLDAMARGQARRRPRARRAVDLGREAAPAARAPRDRGRGAAPTSSCGSCATSCA